MGLTDGALITRTLHGAVRRKRETFVAEAKAFREFYNRATTTGPDEFWHLMREFCSSEIEGAAELRCAQKVYDSATGERRNSARENLAHQIEGAERDPIRRPGIEQLVEKRFRKGLEQARRKLDHAEAFDSLLEQYLKYTEFNSDAVVDSAAGAESSDALSTEVARPEMALQKAEFERLVFDSYEGEEAAVAASEMFIDDLFDEPLLSEYMTHVREKTHDLCKSMKSENFCSLDDLAKYVETFIATDLLSESKRSVLEEIGKNKLMLKELLDVINKMARDADTWRWSDPVPLTMRRQLNGKYRIYMDEEICEALFLHILGVRWCAHLREIADAIFEKDAWLLPPADEERAERRKEMLSTVEPELDAEEYAYSEGRTPTTVAAERLAQFRKYFFLAHIPKTSDEAPKGYDHGGKCEVAGADPNTPQGLKQLLLRTFVAEAQMNITLAMPEETEKCGEQTAGSTKVTSCEKISKKGELGECDSDKNDEDESVESSQSDRAETSLKKGVLRSDGFIAIQTDFEWFGPSLRIGVIKTLLRKWGVTEDWLRVFHEFLTVKIFFDHDRQDPVKGKPRNRTRGVPMSHSLSDFFTEAVLFVLDVAINRRTGGRVLPYRKHDDLWFWSSSVDDITTAWRTVRETADALSLKLNAEKSGAFIIGNIAEQKLLEARVNDPSLALPTNPLKWGFLIFSPTERVIIDRDALSEHVDELTRQLKAVEKRKGGPLALAKAWNAYFSSFLAYNFGVVSRGFGVNHLSAVADELVKIHARVLAKLGFEGKTIIDYMKSQMPPKCAEANLLDAFWWWPLELGGVGLTNPVTDFVLAQQIITKEARKEATVKRSKTGATDSTLSLDKFQKWRDDNIFRPLLTKDQVKFHQLLHKHKRLGCDAADFFSSVNDYASRFAAEHRFEHWHQAYIQSLEPLSLDGDIYSPLNGAISAQMWCVARAAGKDGDVDDVYVEHLAATYAPELVDEIGSITITERRWAPVEIGLYLRSQRMAWCN